MITYVSALTIAGNPVVPSFSEVGVSTRRMFAPGAITCDHSTSSSVSPAQPSRLEVGRYLATRPAGWITLSDGGSGRPNFLSNTPRSWRTVGDP